MMCTRFTDIWARETNRKFCAAIPKWYISAKNTTLSYKPEHFFHQTEFFLTRETFAEMGEI